MTTIAGRLARYATCATYADRGTSTSLHVYDDGREPMTRKLSFSTLFDRASGAFRFEYEEPSSHAVIWRARAGDAQMWWTVDQKVRSESMFLAIAARTGVSSGTAVTVPSLLLGLPPGEPMREGGTVIDEGDEQRVILVKPHGTEQHLYLSDGGTVLRRFSMHMDIAEGRSPFHVEQWVHYEPVFDEKKIEPSRFHFVPPRWPSR